MAGIRQAIKRRMERLFPSWEAAVEAAGCGYEEHLLAQFRYARFKIALVEGAFSGLRTPSVEALRLAAILSNAKSVVDIGGGYGDSFFALQRTGAPVERYTISELPAVMDLARREVFDERLSFSDQPSETDIVFSSGALPYMADWRAVLRPHIERCKGVVVLARNSFRDRVVYRVQASRLLGHGFGRAPSGFSDAEIRIPHQTLTEVDLDAFASDLGFRRIARLEDETGVHRTSAADYGGSLVYART